MTGPYDPVQVLAELERHGVTAELVAGRLRLVLARGAPRCPGALVVRAGQHREALAVIAAAERIIRSAELGAKTSRP